MFTTNNNFKVFVSNVDTIFPTTAGVDLSAMTTGQLAILNANDQVLSLSSFPTTLATTSDAIKFAMKSSNGVVSFSDKFKIKDIVSMSARQYIAPSEQVSYVGYDGTSGAINAIDYNEYILSLIYKHDDMMWSEQINIKPYLVTTESGALASTVATQFAKLVNTDSYSKVSAQALCSAVGTAISNDAGDTVLGSIGSTTLVIADATDDNDIAVLGVGDFIRMGTATSADVYKIVSGSTTAAAGGTLTLDRPLLSTVTLAGTTAEYITAAEAAAASWGIKFTGLTLDWVAKGVFPYKQVAFDLTLKGFGSTTQSTTAATYPMGYYKQVSDIEWFSQFGSDGLRNATQHPVPTGRSETSSSIYYDCYTIRYKGSSENDPIVGQSNLTATIYFFIPTGNTTYMDYIFAPLAVTAGVSIV